MPISFDMHTMLSPGLSLCIVIPVSADPEPLQTRRSTRSNERTRNQDPRRRRKSRTFSETSTCQTSKNCYRKEEETHEFRCRPESRRSLSFHWLCSVQGEGMGTGRVEVETRRGWGITYIPFSLRIWLDPQSKLDGRRTTRVEDEDAQVRWGR